MEKWIVYGVGFINIESRAQNESDILRFVYRSHHRRLHIWHGVYFVLFHWVYDDNKLLH